MKELSFLSVVPAVDGSFNYNIKSEAEPSFAQKSSGLTVGLFSEKSSSVELPVSKSLARRRPVLTSSSPMTMPPPAILEA